MINLELKRFCTDGDTTLGVLSMDGVPICATLEDEARTVKVMGETRIPAGTYWIGARTWGGHYERYTAKWDWHRGMLQLQSVPGFTDILIHIGNTEKDTAGCILVGNLARIGGPGDLVLVDSTGAYTRIYRKLISAAEAEPSQLSITIVDADD